MHEDTLLSETEKMKVIDLLRQTRFEEFEIHPHYYDTHGLPRHGVLIDKAKVVYGQFDKIVAISKRRSLHGFKYCVVYKISNKISYYLLFFLDEKPMKLFNAYPTGKNIEKRLLKKYFGVSR